MTDSCRMDCHFNIIENSVILFRIALSWINGGKPLTTIDKTQYVECIRGIGG